MLVHELCFDLEKVLAEQVFLASNSLGMPQVNSNEALQMSIAMNRGSESNIVSFSKSGVRSCEAALRSAAISSPCMA
ncbi:hypothetical protein [Paraherbaspirillum soli]|uniref:Uncharacterized protein n=1 Tax=Paraherbaspirillum soli TaxID=631222 RepID=A0ABW0MFU2_9BURK